MSDDSAMPLSSNLAHARTSAIDSAAAAAATKYTAEVKRAHERLGLKDTAVILIISFPSSINPSDAAQQLTRSVKSYVSDIIMICNDDSHEGLNSTNWIPGWECPL